MSRRPHRILYGPDRKAQNREEDVVYILSGSGESWRQRSLDAHSASDGTLLVHVNTRDVMTGPLANVSWRIMDPTRAQYGDGGRLRYGENQ